MRANVTFHRRKEHLVVAVAGVMDSRAASRLYQRLSAAIDERRWQQVTIDLSRVKLLKMAGISPLVTAFWRATRADSEFGVVAPHHPVRSALTLARLDWLMPIYDSVREAAGDADTDVAGHEELTTSAPPSDLTSSCRASDGDHR